MEKGKERTSVEKGKTKRRWRKERTSVEKGKMKRRWRRKRKKQV